MLLTVLATDLAAAVLRDEQNGEGFDLSAGMFGVNVSAWLREVAAVMTMVQHPPPPLSPAIAQMPFMQMDPPSVGEPNGLLCALCGEPQTITPSGASCPNGHGGTEGFKPPQTPPSG